MSVVDEYKSYFHICFLPVYVYTHSRTSSSLFQVFFIFYFFNENTQKAAQRFCELRRPLKVGRELLNYAKFYLRLRLAGQKKLFGTSAS